MAHPQPTGARSRTRMRTAERVAWISVLGVVAVPLIQAHPWAPDKPANAATGIAAAKDVLYVESLHTSGEKIDPKQLQVTLSGKLLQPVPSGRQIWAAARKRTSTTDTGGMQEPGLSFTPVCVVNERDSTFDCGKIQLGPDTPEAATYIVYIGLADSNAEKQLLSIEVDQEAHHQWSHPAPTGLDEGTRITVERPAS